MIDVQRMDGMSYDPQQDLFEWLRKKLPEAFTEGKIDCAKLKATLGEVVDTNGERYGLSWAGKADCFRHIQAPTTATLKPVREQSVDFDTTKNLFIEGDNLQVLKVLQKSYYGRVKMIYIDPPYNTGSDSFIYPDRFQESQEEYMERIGDKEEGHVTRDGFWQKNSGDNGHYHSNWLSMMYPRLFLARNLLREDGVIFVSIDDHEVHNLRCILNEIFGEENFVSQLVWEKKYTRSNDARWFSDNHDHILVFARSKENLKFNLLPRTEEQIAAYSNPDHHPKGVWKATPLHAKSGNDHSFSYVFRNGVKWEPPRNTYPRFSIETLAGLEAKDEIWFGVDGKGIPQRKTFLCDAKDGTTPITIWTYEDVGHNHEANNELKALTLGGLFDNPKPTKLIIRMLQLSTNHQDIILDFFTGSGTTAHAVMALNAEDGGNRQCISVQLDEVCEEDSEAKKDGFNTIADIAKERIRRAGKKIKEETGKEIDDGFKVLTLDESNFKIWRSDITDAAQLLEQMHLFIDNVKAKSTQENVLYELMLKSGLDLHVKVEAKKADGKTYFALDGGTLIVCLEDGMSRTLADAITAEKPEKVICLDGAFQGNDQLKTNTALQMEAAKIDFRVI